MKKLTQQQLRQIVEVELFRGVPEFLFQEATRKYVDEIRKHVKAFILQNHSTNHLEQHEAFESADEILTELEGDMNDLLESKLIDFLRTV
jgi:hypothetical protein